MTSNNTTYSLPWPHNEESGFHDDLQIEDEHEYSNTVRGASNGNSYESRNGSSDDYEEVCDQVKKGLVYNLASEGIFQCQNKDNSVAKQKIMQSIIYCIHKVRKYFLFSILDFTKFEHYF